MLDMEMDSMLLVVVLLFGHVMHRNQCIRL